MEMLPNERQKEPSEDSISMNERIKGWAQRLAVYDTKYYHWLKDRSPWVVAFVLCLIVGCSIGVGWSLRLKTFNIADGAEMHDAVVGVNFFCGLHSEVQDCGRLRCLLGVQIGSAFCQPRRR